MMRRFYEGCVLNSLLVVGRGLELEKTFRLHYSTIQRRMLHTTQAIQEPLAAESLCEREKERERERERESEQESTQETRNESKKERHLTDAGHITCAKLWQSGSAGIYNYAQRQRT